jgi:8-oxo-dGTP diphosphatase
MRQPAGSSTGAGVLSVDTDTPSVDEQDNTNRDADHVLAVPIVDLRIVLLTLDDGRLQVALHASSDFLRLPRGAPERDRSLDTEARQIVRRAVGLREQYLEQLYTLTVTDNAGWTVVVSYLGLISSSRTLPLTSEGSWHNVAVLPPLSEPDRMVIDYALVRLRAKLGYTTVAFHLLPAVFTLSELQGAYEVILNQRLDKRNFRRRVTAAGILEATGAKKRDGSHRPALIYQFRATDDRETYLTPKWAEGA